MNPWQTQAQALRVAAQPVSEDLALPDWLQAQASAVGVGGACQDAARARIRSISGVTNRRIEASPQAAPDIHSGR